MTIDEMPAGREMNLLIADKVMLLPCVDDPPGDGRNCPRCGYLDYSTDIAAAWEVAEKMRATYGVSLYWRSKRKGEGCWVAKFLHRSHAHEATGDTAPLAICRAALKAVTP